MAQSSSPAPPPLLLTKRITGFLAHALSAHIHTALLCSPAGKLLAHVSAPLRPVADLRMQATVAASLISLYAAASTQIAPALSRDDDNDSAAAAAAAAHHSRPHSQMHTPTPAHHPYAEYPPQPDSPPSSGWATDDYAQHHHAYGASPPTITTAGVQGPSGQPPARPHTITVQLATGAVVVRELACGLLFVCVGASSPSSTPPDDAARSAPTAASAAAAPAAHLHPGTAAGPGATGGPLLGGLGNAAGAPAAAGSPDEADSVLSAGAITTASAASTTASVAAVAAVGLKKAAEEFARRLDGRLAALCVPEEGVFE